MNNIFYILLQIVFITFFYSSQLQGFAYYIDPSVKDVTKIQCELNKIKQKNNTFYLFTHGKPGRLFIDGQWLNELEIANKLTHLVPKNTKHINIYGCEFGKGIVGRNSVERISKLVGVSISASDDLTGVDGDWDLEVGSFQSSFRVNNYLYNLQSCAGRKGGILPSDDFDGDGICNSLDFDDDNDGIVDTSEDLCASISSVQTKRVYSYDGQGDIPSDGITALSDNSGSTRYVSNRTDTINIIEYFFPGTDNISSIRIYNGDGVSPYNQRITFIEKITFWDGTGEYLLQLSNVTIGINGTSFVDIPLGTTLNGVVLMQWNGTYGTSSGIAWGGAWLRGCKDNDFDGDGLTNRFDLDSDGDGCPDAIEGANGNYKFADINRNWQVIKGAVYYNSSNSNDNRNGVPNNGLRCDFGTSRSASINGECRICEPTSTLFSDYDSDGYGNYCDYDMDNDGILDRAENNCLDGKLVSYSIEANQSNTYLNGITLNTNIPGLTVHHSVTGNYTHWHAEVGNNGDTINTGRNGNDYNNPMIMSYKFNKPVADLKFSIRDLDWQSLGSEQVSITGYYRGAIVYPDHSLTIIGKNTIEVGNNKYQGMTRNDDHSSYDNGVLLNYFNKIVDSLVVVQLHTANFISQGVYYKFEGGCALNDLDLDGLPNYIDLDSDGDGCPDAIEGGANILEQDIIASSLNGGNSGTQYNGSAGPVSDNLNGTIGSNGVPTKAGSGQTVGESQTYSATFEPGSICAIILPIQLSTFYVKRITNNCFLSWTTFSETNNDYFAIERSFDGTKFEEIGIVQGIGNTSKINEYKYIDRGIGTISSTVYYRLRQVDLDGSFVYSEIRVVTFENKQLNIYPNPARDYVMINKPIIGVAKVYNIYGELLIETNLNHTNLINVNDLSSGIYLIRIEDYNSKNEFFNKKFSILK